MTKIRGKIRMTAEFLETLLGLPEEVSIVTLQYDPEREILTTVLASEEVVDGYTFEIGESQTIPDASDDAVEVGLDMEAVLRTLELGLENLDELESYIVDDEEEE